MAVCQTRSVGALLERRPGRGPHVTHSGTPPVVELVVGLVNIGAHVEVSGMGGRQPVQGVPGLVTNLVSYSLPYYNGRCFWPGEATPDDSHCLFEAHEN